MLPIIESSFETPLGNNWDELQTALALYKVALRTNHAFHLETSSPLATVEWNLDPNLFPVLHHLPSASSALSRLVAKHGAALRSHHSLERVSNERIGIFVGTSSLLGLEEISPSFVQNKEEHWEATKNYISQWQSPGQAVQVGIQAVNDYFSHRFSGSFGLNQVVSTACSSSAWAIAQAGMAIEAGLIDFAIAGGVDVLSAIPIKGFECLQLLDPNPTRPFERSRAGINLGEASALFLLGKNTSAPPVTSFFLSGWGASSDAYHITQPDPSGKGMKRAMVASMERAKVCADSIDYINTHGTGTPANDSAELNALQDTFGSLSHFPVLEASKSFHGHCLGSAGAIEALVTLARLHKRLDGLKNPPEMLRDLASTDPKRLEGKPIWHGLSNSFGFGGNNVCLTFSYHEAQR